MTIINPIERRRVRSHPSASGPHIVFAGALAAVVAAAAALAPSDPSLSKDHLLPATSLLLFVLAAAVAVVAWRRPARGPRLAAVEPEQMVRLVAGTDRTP